MSNYSSLVKSRFVHRFLAIAAVVAIAGIEPVFAEPIFSVGAKETVYSSSKRKGKGASWPDGNFGVISNGDGTYDFYAANSSKIKVTQGTLTDPAKKKIGTGKIYDVPKKTYKYVAGGPIYEDPTSGARLMVYHAEIHKGGKYSSLLGLAASVDPKGLAFYDLGPIISPNMPHLQASFSVDVGGGSFAIKDGMFNVYFRDYMANRADGFSSELAVAQAPLEELVSNSLNGIKTEFKKYYNGGFTQPALGGLSSPLEVGNPANWWSSVSYNEYLDQMVLVSSQWQSGGTGPDLYMATSSDGINWSARQPLVLDAGEQMYPTIVGTGADPQITGQSFYVYYTDGPRWSKAQLARRLVTLDPTIPPPPPGSGTDPGPGPDPGPEPIPMDWSLVSNFRNEFQGGGPADGWKYAWNPTGKLGNASAFTPLLWSESAQVYNTTGGATKVPAGSKTHADDYLQLAATWGHPGKPNYMPIVGYTIQDEDGAGAYRIIDSAIQKTDGSASKGEDGLGVLVYLNNTLLGSATSVGTNGALASFNRELGNLNVGDTVWVMIDPLKSQSYDAFKNFNFSLEKLVPVEGGMAAMSLMATAVPEPSSAWLVLTALAGIAARRRRQAN